MSVWGQARYLSEPLHYPLYTPSSILRGFGGHPVADSGAVLAWPRVVTSPPPTGRRCSTGRAAHRGPTTPTTEIQPHTGKMMGQRSRRSPIIESDLGQHLVTFEYHADRMHSAHWHPCWCETRSPDSDLMLGHRLRRWPNIKSDLGQCLVSMSDFRLFQTQIQFWTGPLAQVLWLLREGLALWLYKWDTSPTLG